MLSSSERLSSSRVTSLVERDMEVYNDFRVRFSCSERSSSQRVRSGEVWTGGANRLQDDLLPI